MFSRGSAIPPSLLFDFLYQIHGISGASKYADQGIGNPVVRVFPDLSICHIFVL